MYYKINMIIYNKYSSFLWIFCLFLISDYAYARSIRVDQCTIPFDFTIGNICVLGTIGLWVIVPLGIFIFFTAINIIFAILRNLIKRF